MKWKLLPNLVLLLNIVCNLQQLRMCFLSTLKRMRNYRWLSWLSFTQKTWLSFTQSWTGFRIFVTLYKQSPVFLEISQKSQENTCARVSFLIKLQAEACNFVKKEALVQVFSSEFCEISMNTFSYRTPPVAASDDLETAISYLFFLIFALVVSLLKLL